MVTRRLTLSFVGVALTLGLAGCSVFEDLDALRSTEPTCEIEDPCDGCTERNACGGCAPLTFELDVACGKCDTGLWACDGQDAQTCQGDQGDAALNACGGCSVLAEALDEACGTCDTGRWVCDGREGVTCEGDEAESALNACGGCSSLAETLGTACGTCDTGQWTCDGQEGVACADDQGEAALNTCGACLELAHEPGDACGDCMQYACAAVGGDVECVTVGLTDYFLDSDGDTFGDPNLATQNCTQPDGYVLDATDCNDNNANVNPNATELANDLPGDNDCDGFVRLEPASFNPMTLGSPTTEPGRGPTEAEHEVTLSRNLLVATTEVTRGWWQAVVPTLPANQTGCVGDSCPVECVDWFEALEFLNRASTAAGLNPCYTLTGCTGTLAQGCGAGATRVCDASNFQCDTVEPVSDCSGFFLPTEAEWEFAVRASDLVQPFYRGAYGNADPNSCAEPILENISWYCGTAASASEPVAGLDPNRFGLYDMSGNVAEWVWDWRGDYPTDLSTDPTGPATGTQRIVRGGDWSSLARECRSAERGSENPVCRSPRIGLRAARIAP